MKRIIYLIAATLCWLGNVATAQTVKLKVAVYVTGEAENAYKKVIGSKLVTAITRSDKYAAVERTVDFLAELNKEQDYQMSGAVSDQQIARLGQQFGVRYVLVADISEVFDSMFISARMIDVQTAQIINSAEVSQAVNDMESLSKISENIVVAIIGESSVKEDDIRKYGPFTNAKDLANHVLYGCPSGYHQATPDDIEALSQNMKLTGKQLSFPIYTNVKCDRQRKRQNFEVTYYKSESSNKVIDKKYEYRLYYTYNITCTVTKSDGSSQIEEFYFVEDPNYDSDASRYKKGYLVMSDGLFDMSKSVPSITPGYIYYIKNKK